MEANMKHKSRNTCFITKKENVRYKINVFKVSVNVM